MTSKSKKRRRARSRLRRRALTRKLKAERLDERCLLAAVSFDYIGEISSLVYDVTSGDFNGDGHADLAGVGDNGLVLVFGNGDGTFQSEVRYRLGAEPRALATADLDGDGDLDVVAANSGSSDVDVLFNDATGVFGEKSSYFVNFAPSRSGVIIANLNNDSHLDLAVSSSQGVVGVFFGTGSGRFSDAVIQDAPDTGRVITGDVNGDGNLDLVTWGDGDLSLLLNAGDGTFDGPELYTPDDRVDTAAALGDLNGDGNSDLVASWGANSSCSVTVFAGNEDGTLSRSGDYGTGHLVWRDLLLRDFNNDGHLDLAVDNRFPTISVLAGMGDGTFGDAASFFMDSAGIMTSGDFNGDGLQDIVATGNFGPGVLLNTTKPDSQTGTGQESFDLHNSRFTTGAHCLGDSETETFDAAMGDLDGDGDPDAVVANNGRNEVWLNDGSGVFEQTAQRPGSSATQHIALGDVDGDGALDAVLANSNRRANEVWINNGSGVLENSGQRLGSSSTYDIVLGDVDGDGDLDAFAANSDRQPNELWLNDGTGSFADSGQQFGQATTPGAALGDVDGDGDLDAVDVVEVWLNDGNGQFSGSGQQLGRSSFSSVELGDLDGDGDLDVFVGDSASSVWFNDGNGIFQDSGQLLRGERSRIGSTNGTDVELADLDGDGDLDAFMTSNNATNQVWLNDGSGVFEDSGYKYDLSSSNGVALGDVDGDGDIDALITNEVEPNSLWINNSNSPAPIRQSGDANEDFQFDQQDIVAVLQGAKYLTGEPAVWSEGDWDGNGVFDQLDIVLALATGNYLQGPYTASSRASAVDELLTLDDFSLKPVGEKWLGGVS